MAMSIGSQGFHVDKCFLDSYRGNGSRKGVTQEREGQMGACKRKSMDSWQENSIEIMAWV